MIEVMKKKQLLQEQMKKLKEKQIILNEKEKRNYQKKLISLGSLVAKASIDQFDENILLGAFLEIFERSSDPKILNSWKERSKQFSQDKKEHQAITISFKSPPSIEVKDHLKSLKFKWNSFRGEFYGFADKKSLTEVLGNIEFKIEEVLS